MEAIIALLSVLGLGTGAVALVIRNLYYICQPSEVLILRAVPGGQRMASGSVIVSSRAAVVFVCLS